MAATKLLSNKNVAFFAGLEAVIDDFEEPSLADLQDLVNITGATNVENTELNISASDQQDDRVWTDAAGAQSRGLTQFGGALQFVMPEPTDTTSIYADTQTIVAVPGTVLATAVRTAAPSGTAIAAGQEVNVYRVQSNIPSHGKNDVSHYYDVNFLPRNDVLVNYIVPASSPAAATLTPSAAITDAEVGDVGFITATYQGRRATIGAEWVSSNPAIVEVSPHGVWHAVAVGGPVNITAKLKGGLVSTAKVISVI